MTARILHLGSDDCLRVPVLRCAGYAIDDCCSLRQLQTALQIPVQAEVVVLTEIEDGVPNKALSMVRAHSTAPVVLFPGRAALFDESDFDLIVPPLTPPETWLTEIAALIQESRAIHMRSQQLAQQSPMLREAPVAARKRFRLEQERSWKERARNSGSAVGL